MSFMSPEGANSYRTGPSADGHFGLFGGRYVAETLMPLILEVEKAYYAARQDQSFLDELKPLSDALCGSPKPALFR